MNFKAVIIENGPGEIDDKVISSEADSSSSNGSAGSFEEENGHKRRSRRVPLINNTIKFKNFHSQEKILCFYIPPDYESKEDKKEYVDKKVKKIFRSVYKLSEIKINIIEILIYTDNVVIKYEIESISIKQS